jgi:hypothetical protein
MSGVESRLPAPKSVKCVLKSEARKLVWQLWGDIDAKVAYGLANHLGYSISRSYSIQASRIIGMGKRDISRHLNSARVYLFILSARIVPKKQSHISAFDSNMSYFVTCNIQYFYHGLGSLTKLTTLLMKITQCHVSSDVFFL